MANIKSSAKRDALSKAKRATNRAQKSALRTTIKKFETHSKFKIVTESDIEVIRGYFEDFELWAEEMYYYKNYDFDYLTQIKEGDYYYIYVDPNYNTFEYGYYDVYYVDMAKQILYFVHVNI